MKFERALSQLAETFAAFARALALFLIVALTLVLQVLAALLHLATVAVGVLIGFVSALVRLSVVGLVAVSVVWAWPRLFVAFGGDILAALPATLFCLLPVAYMLASGHGLSGLMAAAVIVFGMGTIYPALPTFAQGIVIAGVIGATVTLHIQAIQEARQ